MSKLRTAMSLLTLLGPLSFAQKAILADKILLDQAGIPSLQTDALSGVSYAELHSEEEEGRLTRFAHALGKCGGFEMLSNDSSLSLFEIDRALGSLRTADLQAMRSLSQIEALDLKERAQISEAIQKISQDRIRSHVDFLSAFHTRYHGSDTANVPIRAFKAKIEEYLNSRFKVDLIDHRRTSQKSIRVRLEGTTRPNEIVVLGGHVDSIVQDFFDPNPRAPGADDNASGSADILEVLLILNEMNFEPERSLEFFFYAGEEGGLIGSAEIAENYKNEAKDVVGVMQLDMTSFPGSGELSFSNMTDFTNPALRSFLEQLNTMYVGGRVIHSECGYGCSDHASWHRRGYPAVIPFESHMNEYNSRIHSRNDLVGSFISFEHAAMFAKLGLSFVMELSNSDWRPISKLGSGPIR